MGEGSRDGASTDDEPATPRRAGTPEPGLSLPSSPFDDAIARDRKQAELEARLFADATDLAAAPTKVGRYPIERQLGRGGMGVVYLGRDERLERDVAIKVLRGGAAMRAAAAPRIEREAKALARLSHTHVVTVYEVGEHDDELFIAMEYVGGPTLRRWSATPRPTAELLEVLLQAAEGLSAAHGAGLVHRDFKPDNVLLTASALAKVVDFGLAHDAGTLAPDTEVEAATTLHTNSGALAGTPAYMAPEQLDGGAVDARADQFAWCVTVVEALTGARPFVAPTLGQLRTVMEQPPALDEVSRKLPRRAVEALRRGLAERPEDRHPDLATLIAVMRPKARQPWPWVGLAAAAGFGAWALSPDTRVEEAQAPCTEGDQRVANAWSTERRERIATVFVATDLPHGRSTWQTAQAKLDAWTQQWAATQRGACEATRVHRTQSAEALDLQTACLQRQWNRVDALLTAYDTAGRDVVARAIDAVDALPEPASCRDTTRLSARTPPPTEADARREHDALTTALTDVETQLQTGRYDLAQAAMAALVERAQVLDHAPTNAWAHHLAGRVERTRGREVAAEEHLRSGLVASEAGGDDDRKVLVAMDLSRVLYESREDHAEALAMADLAQATLRRLEAPASTLSVDLHDLRSSIHRAHGDWDEAQTALDQANQTLDQRPEPHPLLRARLQTHQALLAKDRGDAQDAEPLLREAMATYDAKLGESHPRSARMHGLLAAVLIQRAQLPAAEQEARVALGRLEVAVGQGHPWYRESLFNLTSAIVGQGRHEQARTEIERLLALLEAHTDAPTTAEARARFTLAKIELALRKPKEALAAVDRALEIVADVQGTGSVLAAICFNLEAEILRATGKADEASKAYASALDELSRANRTDHPIYSGVLMGLGQIDMTRGDATAARKRFEQARTALVKRYGEAHIHVVTAMEALASADAMLGREDQAITTLQRALVLLEQATGSYPAAEGYAHQSLAMLLIADPESKAKAIEHGQTARRIYAEANLPTAAVDAWLTEQAG